LTEKLQPAADDAAGIIIITKRIYTWRLKAEVTRHHSFNQSNKCVFSCALNCS